MITRIEATRYRCFDKLDVELGDFRVLVGANSSGKTTLLGIPVLLGDMFRHEGGSLRKLLAADGRWPECAPKPPAPKDVIQALIRTNRAGPPVVVCGQIAKAVSTAGCVDLAFHRVRDPLRAWSPAEGA